MLELSDNFKPDNRPCFAKKRADQQTELFTPVQQVYQHYFNRKLGPLFEQLLIGGDCIPTWELTYHTLKNRKEMPQRLERIIADTDKTKHWIADEAPTDQSGAGVYCVLGHHAQEVIPLTLWKLTPVPLNHHGDTEVIFHTSPKYLNRIEQIIHEKLHALGSKINDNTITASDFYKAVGSIYWWAANGCLNHRGSAACTEMMCRALCKASGFDWPLHQRGVSLDLECMARSEPEFIRALPSFWEHPSTSLPVQDKPQPFTQSTK